MGFNNLLGLFINDPLLSKRPFALEMETVK